MKILIINLFLMLLPFLLVYRFKNKNIKIADKRLEDTDDITIQEAKILIENTQLEIKHLYFIFKIINCIQMIILVFILFKILKNNYNIFYLISINPILITYIYCYVTKNFSMINFELFLIESKIELEKDISDDLKNNKKKGDNYELY